MGLEPDDGPAGGEQPVVGVGVSLFPVRVQVVRAVDVDSKARVVVHEVGAGAGVLHQDLGPVGQPVAVAGDQVQPVTLQVAAGLAGEPAQVLAAVGRARRRGDGGHGELVQVVTDQHPVDELVVGLVGVGQEAVVARGLAVFPSPGGTPQVGERVRVEMAAGKRLPGDPGKGGGILHHLAEDACAAFRRLVQQDRGPVLTVGQADDLQLGVLQVVLGLDGHLESGLETGHEIRLGVDADGVEHQDVAAVLNVGDDILQAAGERVVVRDVLVLGAGCPPASFEVEQEAVLVAVLAAGPADVDAGERRGVAVGQAGALVAAGVGGDGGPHAGLAVDLGPPVRVADLVAPALALLGVGIDPVLPAGGHAGHPEQRTIAPPGGGEVRVAPLAPVRRSARRCGVKVTAHAALRGGAGDDRICGGGVDIRADGDHDPVHPVHGAFVVDERLGAELGDGDEPRPAEVLIPGLAPPGGDPRGQRQPGEAVAGQEALRREVPVGVEV